MQIFTKQFKQEKLDSKSKKQKKAKNLKKNRKNLKKKTQAQAKLVNLIRVNQETITKVYLWKN